MFLWKVQAEAKANATSEQVWNVWTQVTQWPVWDHELVWARLEGDFQVGRKGELKPKGWCVSTFHITETSPKHSFTTESAMPFTRLIFKHTVMPCGEGKVLITHEAEISGLLAPLLFLTMRGQLKRGLPEAVKCLAQQVEINRL